MKKITSNYFLCSVLDEISKYVCARALPSQRDVVLSSATLFSTFDSRQTVRLSGPPLIPFYLAFHTSGLRQDYIRLRIRSQVKVSAKQAGRGAALSAPVLRCVVLRYVVLCLTLDSL